MAYEKQTWECGETITVEKLNHIENGIADASSGGGGSVRVIKPTGESEFIDDGSDMTCTAYYYDITYAELCETMENGTIVFAQFPIPTGATSGLAGVEQIQIVSVPVNGTPFEETPLLLAYDSRLSALYTNESGKLYTKACVVV